MFEDGQFVEMRDGSLRRDPGEPVHPPAPEGYEQDAEQPHIYRLSVPPKPCACREIKTCPSRACERWFCLKDPSEKLPINPGVCVRCQAT